MLMMWKIQQAKRDDAIRAAGCHTAFIPVTALKCSNGKIFQPAYRDSSWKNRDLTGTEPVALSYEYTENFTKDLEVRPDLGNRASSVNRAHVKRP